MGKWRMVRLGDVLDIGSSKRVFQSEWRDKGVPFYRAREIVKLACDGYVDNKLFIDETMYNDYARKYGIPSEGDIMVTGVGTLGVCYIVKSSDRFYFKDGNILWFKKKVPVNSKYIISLFDTSYIKEQIQRNSSGTTVGTFTISTANKIQIPLPPLSVQEKIADVLDRASALVEKRKAQIEKLDLLVKSQFVEMFGDFITTGDRWNVVLLGQNADIVSGVTKGRKLSEDSIKIPYLRVANVKDGYLDLSEVKTIFATSNELSRYQLKNNDVLMTEGGDPDKLGRGAIWNEQISPCIHQNHIFRVRLNEAVIHPVYFTQYLLQPYTKRYFLRSAKQTTGIASINMTQLKKLPIYVPPHSLQTQFASFVGQVETQKSLLQQSLAKLEQNYKSLMQKCFRGEIV